MNTRSLFLSLLTLGWITSSYALELPTGARPMGLAAFSAIADDANAVKWNPAGLTQLSRQELTTMWTELFKSGFTQSHLGYALPITNKLAIGADWTAIQFDDAELAYRQDRVHLAGAYRPFSGFSFGFNIKSLFSSTQVDQISEGDTRRFDGDIGVLFRPHSEIQLAFVLRDVVKPLYPPSRSLPKRMSS
ncbi:hypothetical protein HYR99_17670 [Candidatus Poribacteria bacterium]|nr:hypothetical protein [Candidatus Poribacteria bacterium]